MNVDVQPSHPIPVSGHSPGSVPPDGSPQSPTSILLHSSCVGDIASIHRCMSSGYCDVDQTDSKGRSALHWATARGHLNVVSVLVTLYHASIDLLTQESETPLIIAVLTNNLEMVRLLISYGAYLQHTNNQGASALHLAAGFGYTSIVRELLSQGAWIELEDNEGESPLFYAVRESHQHVVKLLLDAGANPNHPNNDQDTPLSLAHECDNQDATSNAIITMLNAHVSRPHQHQNLLEPYTRVESRSFGSSSGNLCGFLTKTI